MKIIRYFCFFLLFSLLTSCAKDKSPVFADIKIGIAPIFTPTQAIHLLAGGIQKPQALANKEEIQAIQELLNNKIQSLIRKIEILEQTQKNIIEENIPQNSRGGMLDYWIAYGNYHNVDILLVPYLNYYNDKESSNALLPLNTLVFDFFLIDLRNKTDILDRYLFAEQEQEKNDNINYLEASSFIKRTKNTKMTEMLEDAINQAFTEFNLD